MSMSESTQRSLRIAELLRGWRTLLGATLGSGVGVHALPFYTSGLFLVALQADKGWSRSEISFGTTLFALGLGLAAPIVGALCDRFGERRMIVPGLLIQIAALVALSRIETLAAFYLLMGGMALLGAGCGALPYARTVNANFDLGKGTALGIMITGTALLSAAAPAVIQAVITSHGWRAGYLANAVIVLLIAPVALLLLHGRGRTASKSRGLPSTPLDYRSLICDRTFQLLASALSLAALAAPGVITHLAAMQRDGEVSPAQIAATLALVGLTQAAARLGAGMLADAMFAPKLAATIFFVSSLGFAAFGILGPSAAIIGAAAAGLAYGAEADLLGYLVGRYFPAEQFGRIYGLLVSIFLMATALSPLWYGWSVDHSGGYRLGLFGGAAALCLSALIFRRFPRYDQP